jgi:hypothetical protein
VSLDDFVPANTVEEDLLAAVHSGNADTFLSTLLLAKVLVPGEVDDPAIWPTEEIDGAMHLVAFTSRQRLAECLDADTAAASVGFVQLIHKWPDDGLAFVVNPGSPISATMTSDEIKTLANWAADVGLTGEPAPEPQPAQPQPTPRASRRPVNTPPKPDEPVVMQKTIPAAALPYYLDRGYDRVSGFVHRASEVIHLRTPELLYLALGLSYAGSPFSPKDAEVYVLRWTAHCPNLYRIPYGGRDEPAMRAMQGWVIERLPFRGNGFAAAETDDVIAEFKVDSSRLPHGAQLWRVDRAGNERLVALLDADGPRWLWVGEE